MKDVSEWSLESYISPVHFLVPLRDGTYTTISRIILLLDMLEISRIHIRIIYSDMSFGLELKQLYILDQVSTWVEFRLEFSDTVSLDWCVWTFSRCLL
jgi:hypothetical protein